MLDMAAMRAVMRRFGKLAPPAVSVQRRLGLAPPRSKRCAATLALACLAGWLGSMSGECSKSPGGYLSWPDDGLLRHTVFVGLQEDKPASGVRRERPGS